MNDPLFWVLLSLVLLAACLLVVMTVLAMVLRELGRAARSAERLLDTLNRELPSTLEALRLTGLELTELTEDVNSGIEHASRIVQQVDEGLQSARHQAHQVQIGTRSLVVGLQAAWRMWQRSGPGSKPRSPGSGKRSRQARASKYRYRPGAIAPPAEPVAPTPAPETAEKPAEE